MKRYEFVGVIITSDAKDDDDISSKVSKGTRMTKPLQLNLWNNNMTRKTEK